MKNKAMGKNTTDPRGTPKLPVTRKSKALAKSPPMAQLKQRARRSISNPATEDESKMKKKSSAKSPARAPKADQSSDNKTPIKVKKEADKTVEGSKKLKNVSKKGEKLARKAQKTKISPSKTKLKNKKQLEKKTKGKPKKKDSSQKDVNQFIDIWSLASIGKREASLNATMKVNIMYERQISPKKSPITNSSIKATPSPTRPSSESKSKGSEKEKAGSSNKANTSPSLKKNKPCSDKESAKKRKPEISPKKSGSADKNCSDGNRKRKSQYKIYEDESMPKARKKDTNKRSTKAKAKKVVKKRKKNVFGHSLGNIIERSPRQASLNAKAMIAMEQEDDTPIETAARTKVYDWTEVRSCTINDARKMVWVTGSGDLKSLAKSKKARKGSYSNDTSLSINDVLESTDIDNSNSHSLHNTLLKTIHEIGDARLLKEFMRSQKEDYPGDVDIERCPSPKPPPATPPEPVKEPSTPSPKKKSTPSKPVEVKKTPERQIKKPIVPSPTKPCRVATPIPQFSPTQQRPSPSHISSFVHHPATRTQSMYPNFGDQQHQKQQSTASPTQPIKVTPYAPSSAYVYQCSPANRQQQNIFVPNAPSPMPPFGNDANDLVQRNFPGTFTFNQMGSLSFERRGLNPYQHPQSSAYTPSMHLPMQPIGFNFQQFYQPSIQQLHNQQNLPQSIQQVPLPAHQQYALVPPHPLPPPSVMQQSQPLPPAHINPIRPFHPSTYPQYPNPSPSTSNEIKQDKSCMPPPPPCPVAQSLPQQQSPMTSIVQPLPSYRRAIPVSPQVQSPHKLIKPSPERFSSLAIANSSCNATTLSSTVVTHPFQNPQSQNQHLFKPVGSNSVVIHNPLPIRPIATVNASFRPIACKKETKVTQQNCDKAGAPETSAGSPKKGAVRNGVDESSMSDILHSAHSTMFSVEEKSTSDSPNYAKQRSQAVISTAAPPSSKESKLTTMLPSSRNAENFNGSYSVTSILEMPTCKVKTEPKTKNCAINTEKTCPTDQKSKVTKKEMYYLCLPPPKVGGKPGTSLLTTTAIPIKEAFPYKLAEDLSIKQFPHSNKEVIVIDDTEESSDDEPLAKLVQSKPNEGINTKSINSSDKSKKIGNEGQKVKKVKTNPKALKIKLFEKSDLKASQLKEMKANAKQCKDSKSSTKVVAHLKSIAVKDKSLPSPPLRVKQSKDKTPTTQAKTKQLQAKSPKTKKTNDISIDKAAAAVTAKDSVKTDKESEGEKSCDTNASASKSEMVPTATKPGSKVTKKAPVRRKSKTQALIPPALPKPKAIHGWSWVGEGEMKMIPKLTQLKEESLRIRKCYKSMKHSFGEVISVKDCVILQSDGDGSVPYVGKVSALWENLSGDMMFSMLWYYQPEHTAAGREPEDGEQEVFASKHREENSVACIDDKCYVLMYNEFCRMEANATRHELGVPKPSSHLVIPPLSKEDRSFLRPLPPPDIGMDNICFCRYDYDTRKKIVRKPKHKKTDLRYRGPCKLVQ